jgi:hypothetical protein
MQNRAKTLLYIKIAVIIAVISATLVAATIYYYYTAKVPVSVEAPKVRWVAGSDISASIGTNSSWCQISLSNLEPNATTVYTSALKFTIVTASSSSGMKLQIASVTDTNSIIWGVRFYIFRSGASNTTLRLVEGGWVTVNNTDGTAAVDAVGYKQSGNASNYGSTTTPAYSSGFTGQASTTYVIVIEAYGKDGILSAQTATIQLRLIWS